MRVFESDGRANNKVIPYAYMPGDVRVSFVPPQIVPIVVESPAITDAELLWTVMSRVAEQCGHIAMRFTDEAEMAVFPAMQTLLTDCDVTFREGSYVLARAVRCDSVQEDSVYDRVDACVDLTTLWEKFVYDTALDPSQFESWVRTTYPDYQHLLNNSALTETKEQRYTVPREVRKYAADTMRATLAGQCYALDEALWTLATNRQLGLDEVHRLVLLSSEGTITKWLKRVCAA